MTWVAPEVLIDFTSNPLDPLDFSTATDVTEYVRSISIDRGRQAEDDEHVQPGTATVVLENRDGRFDPNNTGSPYAPNVLPMKRLRVRATDPSTGTVHDIYTGYVMSWPQQYAEGDSEVLTPVDCVDAFTLLANETLPESAFEHYVHLGGSPDHYWRLNEPNLEGIEARDTGGAVKLVPGTYEGGAEPGNIDGGLVPNDPDSAAFFPGLVGDQVVIPGREAGVKGGPGNGFTVALVFLTAEDVGNDFFLPVLFFNAGLRVLMQVNANPGALRLWMKDADGNVTEVNDTSPLNDADEHLIVWRQNPTGASDEGWDLYVDGEFFDHTDLTAVPPIDSPTQGLAGPPGSTEEDSFIDVFMQKVAIYDRARPHAEIDGLVDAFNESGRGRGATNRVVFILEVIGWPVADRELEDSSSTVTPSPLASRGVLEYLQHIETSEAGLLAINPSGEIRFTGRRALYQQDAYNTAQSSWTEDGTGTTLDYELLTLDALSVDDVRNEVRVKREGVSPITVGDSASQQSYTERSLDKGELMVNSDAQVRGAAEHFLHRHKDPAQRIRSLTIDPTDDDAKWTEVLSRRLMERVHVKRSPDGGAWTAIDEDAHIIGISHEITQRSWETTWRLSALDASTTFLLLDDPELGKLDENSLAW